MSSSRSAVRMGAFQPFIRALFCGKWPGPVPLWHRRPVGDRFMVLPEQISWYSTWSPNRNVPRFPINQGLLRRRGPRRCCGSIWMTTSSRPTSVVPGDVGTSSVTRSGGFLRTRPSQWMDKLKNLFSFWGGGVRTPRFKQEQVFFPGKLKESVTELT